MGYTDGERVRARGAAALQARRPHGGRLAAGGPIDHRSLLHRDGRQHDCRAGLAMTAESAQGLGRRSFMRVTCDACGRSAVSDTLDAAQLCQLISWQYDGGAVTCVQCQWVRGERPRFVDRYGPEGDAETRSWLERLAAVGDWWRGSADGGVGRGG